VKASDTGRALALADGSAARAAPTTTVGHFLDLPKD
jgi:pilus assembly protein CpaC